jgi:hypothetical protein
MLSWPANAGHDSLGGLTVILTRLIPEKRPLHGSLLTFLRGTVQTIDGPVKGFDALVQVILVPACLSLGGVAIGVIVTLARASH